MINVDGIIRIDVPDTLMTPAAVEALILSHRGLGTLAANPIKEQKESQDDLKTFLTYATANGAIADEASFQLIRAEERPDILRLSSKHADYLFFVLDTHEDDGKVYEYIKSITPWEPGTETVRPEEHLLISPPQHLNEARLTEFLLNNGFSKSDHSQLISIISEIIHDYPISNSSDRDRLMASRLFDITRIDTPRENNFTDQSGLLHVNIMVADKGSWSRAGRLKVITGWKEAEGNKWAERIVCVERPKGDEPEQHAMPYAAGVYLYIDLLQHDILTGAELTGVLKHHLTIVGAQIDAMVNAVTSPSHNPDASGGEASYRLRRMYNPGLSGAPNPVGLVHLELFTGTRFVGRLELQTRFVKPTVAVVTPSSDSVRADYVEVVERVSIHPETQARMQQPYHGQRWGYPNQSGWNSQGGGFRPQQPHFTQHHAWGPAMQTPFMEEAKLSAFNLDSYCRVLNALVENLTHKNTVRDVIARMYVLREQVSPQQHGSLMYQFEFNVQQGLLMRVISQSGVVHLQQVIYS